MAKLVLENGEEFKFSKSCSIQKDTVTIDGKILPIVKEVEEEEEIPKRVKIYSGMLTPDGTLLSSVHRHDYVTHEDKNGNHYMIDGGTDYTRFSDPGDAVFISIFLDDPIEKKREVVGRSGYGIPENKDYGRFRCARLCEMSDSWVLASIEYVGNELLKTLYQEELDFRSLNNIIIKDSGKLYHDRWSKCWKNIDKTKII